jgi:hypothetical protein
MLVHYLVFLTISCIHLPAFFVRLMPQEIILTAIYFVTDASNFKAFAIISCKTDHQTSRIQCHTSINIAHLRQPAGIVLCFLHLFDIWTSNVCFKWLTDVIKWLQHPSHASWYDYQTTSLIAIGPSHFRWSGCNICLKLAWITDIKSATGCQNHIDLIQSSTRSSAIQPPTWTHMIIPWGNFCFVTVLCLNTKEKGNFW